MRVEFILLGEMRSLVVIVLCVALHLGQYYLPGITRRLLFTCPVLRDTRIPPALLGPAFARRLLFGTKAAGASTARERILRISVSPRCPCVVASSMIRAFHGVDRLGMIPLLAEGRVV